MRFIKRESEVSFDLELDLSPYVIPGLQSTTKYKLIGIVNHSGSLEGGHYTALCRRNNRYSLISELFFLFDICMQVISCIGPFSLL